MATERRENVIDIMFDSNGYAYYGGLWQWDSGIFLRFVNIKDGTEIHFSNATDTKKKLVYKNMVKIPNSFLKSADKITAYVYIVNEDNSYTKKIISLDISSRPQPPDYISPEDEPDFREEINAILTETKDIAQSVRNDADEGKFDGKDGKSAYEIAVEHGYTGTEEEWLLEMNPKEATSDIYGISKIAKEEDVNENAGLDDAKFVNPAILFKYIENILKNIPEFEEKDPTVYDWAKQPEKPPYTAEEVGAEPKGSIDKHNKDVYAHEDIRSILSLLVDRLNAIADSDDETLDQLSELVAYIKDNRELIEQITTKKINTDDIVDNLMSTNSKKVLSANQGRILDEKIYNSRHFLLGVGDKTGNITVEDFDTEDLKDEELLIVMFTEGISSGSGGYISFTINEDEQTAGTAFDGVGAEHSLIQRSRIEPYKYYIFLYTYAEYRLVGDFNRNPLETYKIDGINFNGTANVNRYAVCSTFGDVAQKEIEVSNIALTRKLPAAGACVKIKFENDNTAENPMLKVNNGTAIPIYDNGLPIVSNMLKANNIYEFIYDGTNWNITGGITAVMGNIADILDEINGEVV